MKLIGLYSPVPQCGKSTVANYLVRKHFATILPFAGALKVMLQSLLDEVNSPLTVEDKASEFYNGKTIRATLQTLGTEWGRKQMGPDFWVDVWKKKATRLLAGPGIVVADDMRFPNEFAAIKNMGGECWCVLRESQAEFHGHSSEGRLNDHPFDQVILNKGNVENLHEILEKISY